MLEYCCKEFRDLLEDGFIIEDDGLPNSHGCFEREKYLLHCYYGIGIHGDNIDMYIRYCPRCGTRISNNK